MIWRSKFTRLYRPINASERIIFKALRKKSIIYPFLLIIGVFGDTLVFAWFAPRFERSFAERKFAVDQEKAIADLIKAFVFLRSTSTNE